jgi:hypothetical protein
MDRIKIWEGASVELQDDRWIRKDLEGSDRDLIVILRQNFPGGTEASTKNVIQDGQCSVQDSNSAPSE